MAVVQLPFKFNPRQYQQKILQAWDSGIKRLILVWHRRSGKDKTAFAALPKKMFERVGTYFYILPTYSQAKKVIWDGIDKDGMKFLDHIPKEIIKGTPNETEMRVDLINGSAVQLLGAENVDRVVGTNPIGVIFSEYSLMKPNVWDLLRPILAENGGWALFIFTPRGMNHAWKLLQLALQDTANWFAQILSVDDTQAIPRDVLDQEKKEMPLDLFEQEYYCKFIEGAGQFFKNIDACRWNAYGAKVEPGHVYKGGVDLAKYHDFTVLTAIDLMTFKVLPQDSFNQIDWVLQEAKIEAFYLRHFKPLIEVDSTGVGDPIYENLSKRGMNVNPFKFTEQSRRDLLVNLQMLLEQRKIFIPDDPELLSQLKSFRYELVGEKGKLRIQAPEGVFDDKVMSLALAVWQLPDSPLPLPGSLRFLNRTEDVKATSYD